MNTHLPTPHLPALTQVHDLYFTDATDFSQGWEGWSFMNLSRGTRRSGWCVAGVFLWGGAGQQFNVNRRWTQIHADWRLPLSVSPQRAQSSQRRCNLNFAFFAPQYFVFYIFQQPCPPPAAPTNTRGRRTHSVRSTRAGQLFKCFKRGAWDSLLSKNTKTY